MRQLISRRYSTTWITGASKFIFSDPVPAGHVVHIKSCVAYSEKRDASDNVLIGYTDGGETIYVTAKATLAAQQGIEATNDFFVGEGDRAFGLFPDVENLDVIELHLNGTLLPIEDFEKGME